MLDEVAYDVYLRTGEVKHAAPMANAVTLSRDEHGVLWRAVNMLGMGWRKVRLT